MSSRFVKVMVPPVVEAPRGAQWAAAMAVWVGRVFGGGRGPAAPARTGRGKSAAPKAVERLGAKGVA